MEYGRVVQRVLTGFAWEGATKIVVQIVSWATTIIVARILLPSDYGLVAVSGVFVGVLIVVTEMGLAEGLINTTTVTKEQEDGLFWLSLMLSGVIYVFLFVSAPLIASLYEMDRLTEIIRVSALVLIFSSLKVVPYSIAMRNMDFRYRAIVETTGQLASAATVLSLAIYGFGVWSLVLGVIAMQLITVAAYLPLLKRFPRFIIRIPGLWSILVFGIKLMASKVLGFFMLRADVFIIGLFLGQRPVGYYSMAYHFATIPLDQIGSIFHTITFPALSRIKQNKPQARRLFLQMHRYLLMIAYPILLGLAAVAEDAIVLLLTEKWKPIVPLLQVLCVVNLLRVSGMLMPPTLEGCGNANRVLMFHIVAIIVLPAAFTIGVQWGLTGVLYAWVIAYPPIYCFLLYSVMRELDLKLRELLKSERATLTASLVMVVAVVSLRFLPIDLPMLARLVLSIGVGASVYLGVFAFAYPRELVELKKGIGLLRGQRTVSTSEG